jgi:DNA modification methylase
MAKKKASKQESPIMVWDVKQVRVRDLIPNELNPRTITADRLERLQDKISRLGFNQPVKLDHDGTLLGGNKRYRSLMEKGYGDLLIPAMVPPRALTEKERQEIIISDNVHEGAWDFDMLADHFELEDLKAWGLEDLPTIQEVLNEGECDEDEVPEARPEPKVVKGEIYILGNHRLMCGDSTAITDVDRLMNGEKADMVFTDPPYNIEYQGVKDKREKIKNDKMSDEDFLDFLRQSIQPSDVMYVCCSWQYSNLFKQAMYEIGKPAKAMIVWDKVNPAQHLDLYFKQHEIIFYHGPFGGKKTVRGDIWELKRQKNTVHPTMKPVELIEIALGDHADRKTVYDGFGGSGSTLIACEKTDRKCFMMELDPLYCGVILDRWQKFTGKKAHREEGKPWDEIKQK